MVGIEAKSSAFDPVRLALYLERCLPGFRGPLTAHKFSVGQSNPTFLLKAASGRYVLRRKPAGQLLASAHAIDREHKVMKALVGTKVPVPKIHLLCEDDGVIGSMFFVMEYLDGRCFLDPSLPDIQTSERATYYRQIVDVLAALATVDVAAAGLNDFGRPNRYVERQIERWTNQYRTTETEVIPEVEDLILRVRTEVPVQNGIALTHGDFRIDNLIFHKSAPVILGIVDWELSTIGSPLVDLSYYSLMLRLPNSAYVRGLGGIDREMLGIPSEKIILADFEAKTCLDIPADWSRWISFHALRFVAILQGVKRRHLQGNASNADAPKVAAMIRDVARLGLVA